MSRDACGLRCPAMLFPSWLCQHHPPIICETKVNVLHYIHPFGFSSEIQHCFNIYISSDSQVLACLGCMHLYPYV